MKRTKKQNRPSMKTKPSQRRTNRKTPIRLVVCGNCVHHAKTTLTDKQLNEGKLACSHCECTDFSVLYCRWFAKCTNEASKYTYHTLLGNVPTCDRCSQFATHNPHS